MKKILYAAVFCLSLFPLIGCAQAQSSDIGPKTRNTGESEAKAEKTKTVAEKIKTDYPNLKPQADEMGQAFIKKRFR